MWLKSLLVSCPRQRHTSISHPHFTTREREVIYRAGNTLLRLSKYPAEGTPLTDPAFRSIDPTTQSIDSTSQSIDPTSRSIDPTSRSIDPTSPGNCPKQPRQELRRLAPVVHPRRVQEQQPQRALQWRALLLPSRREQLSGGGALNGVCCWRRLACAAIIPARCYSPSLSNNSFSHNDLAVAFKPKTSGSAASWFVYLDVFPSTACTKLSANALDMTWPLLSQTVQLAAQTACCAKTYTRSERLNFPVDLLVYPIFTIRPLQIVVPRVMPSPCRFVFRC